MKAKKRRPHRGEILVGTYLLPHVRDALREIADRHCVHTDDLVRLALINFLVRHRVAPRPKPDVR